MKLYAIAALCIVTLFDVGYGANYGAGFGKSMPTCHSKEVKELLIDVFEEHYGRASGDLKFSFSSFTKNETNQSRKEVTCEVTMTTTHKKTGKVEKGTVHYMARYTDDGKVLVKVTDW